MLWQIRAMGNVSSSSQWDTLFQALTTPEDLRAYLDRHAQPDGDLHKTAHLLVGTLHVDISLLRLSEVAESGEHYGSAAVEKAVDAARLVAGKAASLVQAGKAAAAGTVGTKDLLGTTLQLGIVILLVLVGLFFYWGGSVQELEDHPRDSLMSTASRAKGEYNDWNTRNSVGGGGSNLPSQRDLANDPFATKPNPRKKNACVC